MGRIYVDINFKLLPAQGKEKIALKGEAKEKGDRFYDFIK